MSLKINGLGIEEYSLVLAENARNEWYGADEIFTGILEKYFGTGARGSGMREIVLGYNGGKKPYGQFESRIFGLYGNVYVGAGSVCAAIQAVYVLFARFLNGPGADALIPDGETVYSADAPDWESVPAFLSTQDRIVRSCFVVESYLQYDHSRGYEYTYQHHGFKTSLPKAREENDRVTNCVVTMNWVLKDAGIYSTSLLNHKYDGTCGYTYGSDEVREGCEKAFDIIPVDCTVGELDERGQLKPGDVIFFTDHNQIIVNGRTALDGGRGHCFDFRIGAKFRWFVGRNGCLRQSPGLIFRAKDAR